MQINIFRIGCTPFNHQTWQGEVLLEFTGAKITKPDWEKGETPYISYIIDISYHLPPPIEEETREAVTEEAEADTAVTSESTTPMGESIGHRTLSKRWEDFEKLDRELLANENARGAERCRYKRLEGVMGIFGREDPEGGFVTQRRINLQNFSNDIMAVYDDLSEGNKSLLDTFFGVTEIMLEHHRKIAEEEAKRQLEAEPIPDEGSWDSKFLKASDFAFCSCPDDRVE